MDDDQTQVEECFLEKSRIPVFIGKGGSVKKKFEEKFNCKIDVDSKTGEVLIFTDDAISRFVLSNIVTAINLGHNPQNALKLEDENFVIDVIDIKSMVRNDRLKSVLGRVIGKEGSTRKAVEEVTKCSISVMDHFVTIIGPYENSILVHEALEMLIKGSSHKSFYSFLERNKSVDSSGLL